MIVRLLRLSVLLLGAGSAALALPPSVQLPEKLLPGLEPVLQSAVDQSPRMISRTLEVEIAEQSRIQARSGLLPYLGGHYRITETRDDRADQPDTLDVTKTYYDVSVTQPLFHWGERRNNARVGEISKAIADRNYLEGYRVLAQEIRYKYLYLIVQKMAVARAHRYRAQANYELKLAEERLAKRVISEAQAQPIRVAAEQGQIGVDKAEFEYESGKRSLARLAGFAELRDEQIPDEVPVPNHDLAAINQLLAGFLSQAQLPTIEAVNLRSQLEIEELNYRNQKTRLRPKVSVVAGMNQDEQAFSINTAQKYRVNSIYAGLSVSWTVFDGFASQAAVRSSLARRRLLENDYRQVADRLLEQAQNQAKQIDFSARNMAILNRYLISSEGALRTRREDFARGVASESDVALAEIAHYDTTMAAFNGRIDYLIKVGDFLGTLFEDPAVENLSTKR